MYADSHLTGHPKKPSFEVHSPDYIGIKKRDLKKLGFPELISLASGLGLLLW